MGNKFFLLHSMELLGDVGQMEARFDPFGDSVISTQDSCMALR
jgi:hypothetical protein